MKRSTIIVSVILAIVFVSIITIVVAVALFPSTRSASRANWSDDIILYVPLNGAIADGGSASLLGSSTGITPEFVRHRIEEAEDDPAVKAIIFKVNSPGGVVGASQEIAEEIRDSEVPVVIFAGDMVASGAYYFASQADKIVAKPGSLVGSIGVIVQIPDLTGLYEKLGINIQTIKSGKNKDMFQRDLTAEEREKLQALSDESYRQFVSDVAQGRNLKEEKILELATGELYNATTAKKHGLVDEIGGYQTAVDTAAKLAKIKDPFVKEYAPSFFETFFGTSMMESMVRLLGFQSLARDIVFLEELSSTYGMPQYKYTGGL